MPEWYSEGLCFSCTGCGACCTGAPGYVWLKQGEGQRIAGFLGIGYEEFIETYTIYEYSRYSLKELSGGDCVFFNADARQCTVYPVRPMQCRLWPFWKHILLNRENWDKTAESCPGMNRGGMYSAEEIQEKLKLYEQD